MRSRGQRKNIGPRDHDFADGDAVEFDGVVDHFFLRLGNLAELAAGGDDELEFVGRMNGAPRRVSRAPKIRKHQAAGAAHEEKYRAGEGEERLHGRGHGQGNLLGTLQGQRLRNEFAQNHVQVGDQAESDGDGDAVGVNRGVRNLVERNGCTRPGGPPWVRRSSPE